MGKRREGREVALQLLFHWDLNVQQPLSAKELDLFWEIRVAVAGHDLGGDLLAIEAEGGERGGLRARVGVGVRSHRARELADAQPVEGPACPR